MNHFLFDYQQPHPSHHTSDNLNTTTTTIFHSQLLLHTKNWHRNGHDTTGIAGVERGLPVSRAATWALHQNDDSGHHWRHGTVGMGQGGREGNRARDTTHLEPRVRFYFIFLLLLTNTIPLPHFLQRRVDTRPPSRETDDDRPPPQ